METENRNKRDYFLPASILLSAVIIAGAWIYTTGLKGSDSQKTASLIDAGSKENLEENILPSEGIILAARWEDLGKKMVEAGVIDAVQFESVYKERGGLDGEMMALLYGSQNRNLRITPENAGFLLNLFWALGLGNKNEILEKGPMSDSRYGGAENFASTGGWTLAKGDVMAHYSAHSFIALTPEQQSLVERVSKNIYRPCCNNSVYFPDCNHGMAMLGLLELMASQGVGEEEMYKAALQVNSYWFPTTYLTIGKYFQSKGVVWNRVNPKEILGMDYSSISGYRRLLSQVSEPVKNEAASCGA